MLAELIAAVVVLVASGYLLYEAFQLPVPDITGIGPEYWPKILLTGIVLLAIILIITIIVKRDKYQKKEKEVLPYPQNFWITVAATFIYTWLMGFLGFLIATVVFCLAMLAVLKVRRLRALAIYPLSFSIGLTLLFGRIMEVPLPRGIGLFRAISLFFY